MKPRRLLLAGMLTVLTSAAACGDTAPSGLPEALYGTWTGGNAKVHTVRFSEGGRVELNGGQCAGEFQLTAIDGNKGTVRSGYIKCGDVMDGYFTATATVDGDKLTLTGAVLRGEYGRGGTEAAQAAINTAAPPTTVHPKVKSLVNTTWALQKYHRGPVVSQTPDFIVTFREQGRLEVQGDPESGTWQVLAATGSEPGLDKVALTIKGTTYTLQRDGITATMRGDTTGGTGTYTWELIKRQ